MSWWMDLFADLSAERFHAPLIELRVEAWYDAHPEYADRETVIMLTADTGPRGVELVGVGDANHCAVQYSQLVEMARKMGCCKVVIAHNHPGGPMVPSVGDIRGMVKVAEALGRAGITVRLSAVYSEGEGCFCWRPNGNKDPGGKAA